MTLIKKRNGNGLFPSLADAFFTNKFMVPDFMDADFENVLKMPPANISENENEFRIDLSAPGLKREDFKVEVENGDLIISSEKQDEEKEEKENYWRREFSYTGFSRRFPLPENTMEEKIAAKYDNGMLHITLPKKEVTTKKAKKAIEVA
jgi:HSP20 family protein